MKRWKRPSLFAPLAAFLVSSTGASENASCASKCESQCESEDSINSAVSLPELVSSFLLNLRNKYEGVPLRMMAATGTAFLTQALNDFCLVTGCVPSLQVPGMDTLYEDVSQDLQFAKLNDGYIVFGSWMPNFACKGLVETLTDRVREVPAMNWLDIYPAVRESSARFGNDIYMIPLDGNVFAALYRDDVLAEHGVAPPRTLAELADAAELLNGKDLNGDGEADFGICFYVSGAHFWAVVAPHLQTEGTAQGIFFDPDSMEPRINEPIFKTAMEIYKRLILASPFQPKTMHSFLSYALFGSYFKSGRCAIWYDYTSSIKTTISEQNGVSASSSSSGYGSSGGSSSGFGSSGSSSGYGSGSSSSGGGYGSNSSSSSSSGGYGGRRTSGGGYPGASGATDSGNGSDLGSNSSDAGSSGFPPGGFGGFAPSPPYNFSGTLSVVQLPGVACDDLPDTACPHGVDGVNYAPFYATGGGSGLIRATANNVSKNAVFDFFTWLSDPEIGYHIAADPSALMDPFRVSHVDGLDDTSSDVAKVWLKHGWEERQLGPFKQLVQDVFSSDNAVMDIRLPGSEEYITDNTLLHVQKFWADELTLDETVLAMAASWNAVTDKYGLESQRKQYRETLGLGPYVPPATAQTVTDDDIMEAVLTTVGIVLGSLFVIFCIGYIIKRILMAFHAQRQLRRENENKVREHFADLTRLNCNMLLVSLKDFIEYGAFAKFEHARERGIHINLDTYEDARRFCDENDVVFVSHQWLGLREPDPHEIQFNASCGALNALCKLHELDREKVFIWVDYTCIPQSNKMAQRMAIGSIQVYATLPKYFICLVPDAKHELGHMCHGKTYLDRGWCRLEQWARVSVGGLKGMYSYTTKHGLAEVFATSGRLARTSTTLGGREEGEEENWLQTSIKVCQGSFTDPDDRHRLKGVISALWMYAVLTKDDDGSLYEMVEKSKKDVFPPEFFGGNFIAIAEAACAELKPTDWKSRFIVQQTLHGSFVSEKGEASRLPSKGIAV